MNQSGSVAVLYYMSGYLFTVLAAFTVLCVVIRVSDNEDVTALAGLNQRSPLLAAALTLSMVSLAGIPPLAGFFGKFLLLKAVVEHAVSYPAYYGLLGVALIGVVISLYYYFGVIRAIYWSKDPADLSPIELSRPIKLSLYGCIGGMLYLGLFPDSVVALATVAVRALWL